MLAPGGASTRKGRWLVALLIGVVAFATVLRITEPPAPGLDPDAAAYLGSAESFVAGREFRTPTARWWDQDSTQSLSHFPPGYPVAIAMPTALGMSAVESARLVNALAAFVTITTLTLLVIDATSVLGGLLTGASVFTLSSMLEVHVSILSEPLFLALTALVLVGMVRTTTAPWIAGISAALASIERYVGVALVAAVAVWSIAQPGSISMRLRRALVAAAPAVALQIWWILRTRRLHAQSIRTLSVYGDLVPTLKQGGVTLQAWLIPQATPWTESTGYRALLTTLGLLAFALVVAAGARVIAAPAPAVAADWEPVRRRAWRLAIAGALVTASYILVVVASRILADPLIPFDQRMLSPALLLSTLVAALCLFHWHRSRASGLARAIVTAALAAWWLAGARVTLTREREIHELGSDFGRARWAHNELTAYGGSLGAAHPLFTNDPWVVYFHLHRPARDVPYIEELPRLEAFADTVLARDGRVLMFARPGHANTLIAAMRREPRLRVVVSGPVGVVFEPTGSDATPGRPR